MYKRQILYEAVRDLERDRSFAVHEPDETFRRIDKYVGAEFDVIATGHTHMEKQLPRGGGRQGTYFNTGSWVPRIRFTPEMLASPGAFRPIVDALRSGSTIDDLEAHEGLVINRPVVLSVCSGHDGTETRLEAVGLSRGKATRSPLGLK